MPHALRLLIHAALLAVIGMAHAQQPWPSKPVRMVVSQPAGTAPDLVARTLTQRLSQSLGQQVVAENRPGGETALAASAVARAPADGYTLLFTTASTFATNPHTFKTLSYNPERDFAAVALIGKTPFLLLANPSVQAKTLADLIALDKAQPGRLNIATGTPRSFPNFVSSWLNKVAGTQFVSVPYPVMPQGVQDTVAGRAQLVVLAPPLAAPLVQRGALRPIAVTSTRRLPGYETVPAIAESFPGFELVGWFVVAAPAETPVDRVQRVNRDIDRILGDAEMNAKLRDLGVYADGAGTPSSLAEFMRKDAANWGVILRELGVEPE